MAVCTRYRPGSVALSRQIKRVGLLPGFIFLTRLQARDSSRSPNPLLAASRRPAKPRASTLRQCSAVLLDTPAASQAAVRLPRAENPSSTSSCRRQDGRRSFALFISAEVAEISPPAAILASLPPRSSGTGSPMSRKRLGAALRPRLVVCPLLHSCRKCSALDGLRVKTKNAKKEPFGKRPRRSRPERSRALLMLQLQADCLRYRFSSQPLPLLLQLQQILLYIYIKRIAL
jgi:hypothetical protein